MRMATNRAALASAQSTNIRLAITLMCEITTICLAVQDGLSRHLATEYNVMMGRDDPATGFFAAFVDWRWAQNAMRVGCVLRHGTSRRCSRSFADFAAGGQRFCVMIVFAFTILGRCGKPRGLSCYSACWWPHCPPRLGREASGWRRWAAIGVGFIGVLIILQPGMKRLDPAPVYPRLLAAAMFAVSGSGRA